MGIRATECSDKGLDSQAGVDVMRRAVRGSNNHGLPHEQARISFNEILPGEEDRRNRHSLSLNVSENPSRLCQTRRQGRASGSRRPRAVAFSGACSQERDGLIANRHKERALESERDLPSQIQTVRYGPRKRLDAPVIRGDHKRLRKVANSPSEISLRYGADVGASD
jgi:hypothetical protein